jgi:hypothetical protein
MTIEIIKGKDTFVAEYFSLSSTPEADSAWDKYMSPPYTYSAGDLRILAQRLESERDELQEKMADALQEVDLRMLDLERMKQERDEAREKMARQADRIRYLEGATNHAEGTPLSIALKERDEANEELSKKYVEYDQLFDEAEKIRIELEMWRDGNIMHEIHRNELEKVEQERDEARAVAGELADVASKYLSFLLAGTPAKTNETHEKETMRVIDAIKRWKEL